MRCLACSVLHPRDTHLPLTHPPLPLAASPRAVAVARRWVVRCCEALGRNDLTECAELGVSELVTNAMLHGAPPISVALRGTAEHPRFEVRDSSRDTPQQPAPFDPTLFDDIDLDNIDDLPVTFGRGMSIVSMASRAWGVTVEDDGKFVWFVPAAAFHDDGTLQGLFDLPVEVPTEDTTPRQTIALRSVDLRLLVAVDLHYRELRRELRLLALAHEDDYPLAKNLSDMFETFEDQFEEPLDKEAALELASATPIADIDLPLAESAGPVFTTMIEMFDLADAFCRSQRLLTLARTPAQRTFQNWFLGQCIAQLDGAGPTPWSSAAQVRANRMA